MQHTFKINCSQIDNSSISQAVLQRKNAAADILKLSVFDESTFANFKVGDKIEYFADDVRKFCGRITKAPHKTTSSSEKIELNAESPWNDLERIVYQQLWQSADTASGDVVLTPVMRSKIVLGQDCNGDKIDVAAQIRDILNYAVSCGADFSIGAIDVSSQMILDEAKDLSCAEALIRVLKWVPNSSVWFDYSTSSAPALNILSRAKIPTVVIDANDSTISKISATDRPDLIVPCVSIKYERENARGDFTWLTVEDDTYPPTSSACAKNALVMSVELAGMRETCQVHEIVAETLDLESVSWWKNKLRNYASCKSLEISKITREHTDLPRELVEGSITSKMNFDAQKEHITALVSYVNENGSRVSTNFSIDTIATDAESGTYTIWNTSQQSEAVPVGLAKAIYEATQDLQYEGEITLLDADAADFACKRLSIINAETSLSSMNAPIVSIIQDIGKSLTTVKFGPPKHLYPDNIAELFRINRQRKTPTNFTTRADGKIATAKFTISGKSANSDSSNGNSSFSRLVVSEDTYGTVDINSRALNENQIADFKDIHICFKGKLAKAKFLLSEPEYVE